MSIFWGSGFPGVFGAGYGGMNIVPPGANPVVGAGIGVAAAAAGALPLMNPYASSFFAPPMINYGLGYGASPWGYGAGYGGDLYAQYTNPQLGSPADGVRGMGRAALGAAKMLPGVGNIMNGVDFVRDLGQMGRALKGDPSVSVFKEAADLLFHGVGTILPTVGGAYDMAQGTLRAGAAATNSWAWGGLPMFTYNPMGFPGVWY